MNLEKLNNSNTIIFNKEKFPLVEVTIKSIVDDVQYDMFEESWLDLYKRENNFYFIFKITDVQNIHIKYITKIVSFIQFLKNNIKKQYLQFSVIIVSNIFIKHLLNIIFKLTTPVAPVYIVNKNDYYNNLLDDIISNKKITDKIKYVTV